MGLYARPRRLAAAVLAALLLQPSLAAAAPSIHVDMVAAFPSPPYLAELLETAAQENATCYYPILDRIAGGYFAGATTDRELYDAFLVLLRDGGHIASDAALSTFKLALSLRSAAPRVEAHYQYYNTAAAGSVADDDQADGDQAGGCSQWILWEGAQYCTPSLDTDAAHGSVAGHERQAEILPFDMTLGHGPAAILYADISSPDFGAFHTFLAAKARNGEISYRLRHVRTAAGAGSAEAAGPLPVNGYGVELALKRTDYIVIDDRASGDVDPNTAAAAAAAATEVVLDAEDDVADLKALSKSELADLGMSTADYILQSDDPFATLLKVTQDFPKHSSSIAAHNASAAFLAEHAHNRNLMVPPGVNVLWMNGVQLIERQIQPLALLDIVRRERSMIEGARELGLTGKEVVDIFGHQAVAQAKAEAATAPRYDWRDEAEQGRVILWLNDLENDSRYHDYPTTLQALLQATMPGQIPPIGRDVFNQVYPVDLTKPDDVRVVVEQLVDFVRRRLPVRFGIVPLTPTAEAVQQAKAVYYLLESHGLAAVTAYLQQWLAAAAATAGTTTSTTVAPDAKIFQAVVKEHGLREESTVLTFDALMADAGYAEQVRLAQHWADRLGANTAVPPIFVDGDAIPRDDKWLQAMSRQVGLNLRAIQEALFYKRIDDTIWAPHFFLLDAVAKRNALIIPENPKSLQILSVHKLYTEHADLFGHIPVIEASPDTTKETWAVLTAVLDLGRADGLQLLLSALQFRINNPGVTLDIVYNPGDAADDNDAAVPRDLVRALQAADIGALADAPSWQALQALLATDKPATPEYLAALTRFRTAAAIRPGANMLILNGRVLGPIDRADAFTEDDFYALLEYEQAQRILPVYKAVESLNMTAKVSSPLGAAKLTSMTALSTISDVPEGIFEPAPTLRISSFNLWRSAHTSFAVGDAATATVHLNVALDPASETGQRWAPLLHVLAQLDGVYLRVFLNPRDRLQELPVKRFYRSVLAAAPQFDAAGKVRALAARFRGLPSEALLNLGMEVPPAWLVAPKVSVHDLDNIKLSSAAGSSSSSSDITATYELKHILIEGHSEEAGGKAPRGAQLILGTESDDHFADTIIMANLGYFQFKANPGFYHIRLMDGRSADIYSIQSIGSHGKAPVPGDEGTDVVLMDFRGTTLYPRLARNPGMETEEVLPTEGGGGTGSSSRDASAGSGGGGAPDYVAKGLKFAKGLLGKAKPVEEQAQTDTTTAPATAKEKQADINIFSVASGHLYERMLNIMMVSVMQHTNHTVKFWFIEQFLSPSFKDFIPALAAAYGFQYEMVTYKWPHWLRQQKEKQREIWGYKILFLDVLFPLSLDKVIFVDADQIVRADMYDLVTLDLHGAPYGFTPMCDSRTEMEGFRFWKQGYWSKYLRGQPYHISALYVVDLRRFREMAAGDRLRQNYHSLSADPNSLANLDQDLPNHMQFYIPIFSLPQDWLWCETWCSDEALATAKTIDLCNNPQTKEPKLDRARRQVPEWTEYDNAIAAIAKRRRGGGNSGGIDGSGGGGDAGDDAAPSAPIRIGGGDVGSEQKPLGGGDVGGDVGSEQVPGGSDPETVVDETVVVEEAHERDEL